MTEVKIDQLSEAWHAIRAGKITGTRFSKVVMGKSTKGYNDLIMDLTGELITGEREETYSNYDMERGTELEPEAAKVYESEIGDVREIGFALMDGYEDWVGVSPDRLINKGILEIKCPKRSTHLGYIESRVLPNVYKWQVQGGIMVTDAEHCDFMSYYPGMKPFIIRVMPDKDMHEQLIHEIDIIIEKVKDKVRQYNEYSYL